VDVSEARPATHRARLGGVLAVMARGQPQVGVGITDFGGGDPSVGEVGEYRTPLQRVVDDIARSHLARLRAVPTSLQHGIEKSQVIMKRAQ